MCVSHLGIEKNTGGLEQWASVSCIHRQIIKIESFLSIDHKSTLTFCIVTMEKVSVAPTASKDDRKSLI